MKFYKFKKKIKRNFITMEEINEKFEELFTKKTIDFLNTLKSQSDDKDFIIAIDEKLVKLNNPKEEKIDNNLKYNSDICRWEGCHKNKHDGRSYRNCNGCGKPVGNIYSSYCREHDNGINPTTNCRYVSPFYYSCLNCYPEDFESWIPDERWWSLGKWKLLIELKKMYSEERKSDKLRSKTHYKLRYPEWQELNTRDAEKYNWREWYYRIVVEFGSIKEADSFVNKTALIMKEAEERDQAQRDLLWC